MLIDAVGGMKLEEELIDLMTAAGVKVTRFRPLKAYAVKRVANRTHRKILVADGRVGAADAGRCGATRFAHAPDQLDRGRLAHRDAPGRRAGGTALLHRTYQTATQVL